MTQEDWDDFLEQLPDNAYDECDCEYCSPCHDDEEDYGDCNDSYK